MVGHIVDASQYGVGNHHGPGHDCDRVGERLDSCEHKEQNATDELPTDGGETSCETPARDWVVAVWCRFELSCKD